MPKNRTSAPPGECEWNYSVQLRCNTTQETRNRVPCDINEPMLLFLRLAVLTEGYRRLPKATDGYRRPISVTSKVVYVTLCGTVIRRFVRGGYAGWPS